MKRLLKHGERGCISLNMQLELSKIVTMLFLFLIIFISCQSTDKNSADKKLDSVTVSKTQISSPGFQLLNRKVCMVNNRFMNKDQIEIPIDNKKYYGCCPGCVKTLQEDTTYRYADDPFSGDHVDKATAFIVFKPNTKDEVLYFLSETNARKYLEKTKSSNKEVLK